MTFEFATLVSALMAAKRRLWTRKVSSHHSESNSSSTDKAAAGAGAGAHSKPSDLHTRHQAPGTATQISRPAQPRAAAAATSFKDFLSDNSG